MQIYKKLSGVICDNHLELKCICILSSAIPFDMRPIIITALLLSSICVQSQNDIVQKLEDIAIAETRIMVPMRDGIRLCTDIYRPKTDQKVPIIFSRTPYNFNSWGDGEERTRTRQRAYEAVKRGYAYVVQNERGRYFSEGEWDILGTPVTDAYDAFSWMADQSWSNGKIGLYGCSSTAEWQMDCLLYTSPSPRDQRGSRMPSSA